MDSSAFFTKISGIVPDGWTVYNSPPENIELSYPCVLFKFLEPIDFLANNEKYRVEKRYQVTVIDSETESAVAEILLNRIDAKFQQAYPSNGWQHFIFMMT